MNKQSALMIESDEEEDDTELLVDWRGKVIRTASSKLKKSKKKISNGTLINTPVQIDEEICRRISFGEKPLPMVENTPEVSVRRRRRSDAGAGINSEMQFGEGSTPSVVLETPMAAQLDAAVVKGTPLTVELGHKASDCAVPSFGSNGLLMKCSGGADVICLDSDNESDGCVISPNTKDKAKYNSSALCTIEECQERTVDAVYFLDNYLNSEEYDKENQSATGEVRVPDNNPRKVSFESITKNTVIDFTKEIAFHIAGKVNEAAEDTISKVVHHDNGEKQSKIKSISINTEAREIESSHKDDFGNFKGTVDFSVLELSSNIQDLEDSMISLREKELKDGAVKRCTGVIETNSIEKPLLDNLDRLMYQDADNRYCITGNMAVGEDHALQDNGEGESANQQVLKSKGRKPRKEGMEQDETGDLVPKETGNKRQRKDRESIRRDREEEKRHRQEEIARNKQEKAEEKQRQREEKRLKKEEEKKKKASSKAEAAEMRKRQKDREKWGKGKFALKSIKADIDTKVVERGLIGGHLLNRLAEKELSFHIVSNRVQSSILWKMNMPTEDAQLSFQEIEVPYILIVLEAEEFCNMVSEGSWKNHVYNVQALYPGYTVCYLTNKLMSYLTKRDQEHYKNPGNASCWKRPPVEQALARFVTHFVGVHSRLCLDEAEVAEHVVGLTRSLAECRFRRKLTRLSVNANGSHVPKDYPNRDIIKKSIWLKALIAIPKIPPKCAVAIAKKYPSMRSLLNVYLDPERTVHEKEFLLQDLVTEGVLGEGGRRLGPLCSKRVYRILMAQSGSLKTDDVEEGADLFQT